MLVKLKCCLRLLEGCRERKRPGRQNNLVLSLQTFANQRKKTMSPPIRLHHTAHLFTPRKLVRVSGQSHAPPHSLTSPAKTILSTPYVSVGFLVCLWMRRWPGRVRSHAGGYTALGAARTAAGQAIKRRPRDQCPVFRPLRRPVPSFPAAPSQ